MKIICVLLLIVSHNIVAQVSVDTTSIEYKEYVKQEEILMAKARRKTLERKLKPSIFGTNSGTINFKGFNYDSYAGGKYSKVAKSENWSKWSLPDDMDNKLEAFKKRQFIKNISLGAFSVVLLLFILWFLKRRKIKNNS